MEEKRPNCGIKDKEGKHLAREVANPGRLVKMFLIVTLMSHFRHSGQGPKGHHIVPVSQARRKKVGDEGYGR